MEGRIFSTSLWGLGITCVATSSPSLEAAVLPLSTAALTAPTSPRTITVTSPLPIFSVPTRVTSAAFVIASAASIAAVSPLVSTIPNACCAIAIVHFLLNLFDIFFVDNMWFTFVQPGDLQHLFRILCRPCDLIFIHNARQFFSSRLCRLKRCRDIGYAPAEFDHDNQWYG